MKIVSRFPFPINQKSVMRGISVFDKIHIDLPLMLGLVALSAFGLLILYSASNQNTDLVLRQSVHMAIGFAAMIIAAQINPRMYHRWAPFIYLFAVTLLVFVLIIGDASKGAQRWLHFGPIRFQPTELMKIALPLMLAWYLNRYLLPPKLRHVLVSGIIIFVTCLLIAKQPDLGSSLLVASGGLAVLFLSGVRWKIISYSVCLATLCLPALWFFMHDYQKQRVYTFLNPESDPLGTGWNIIQSKIAIGSGGIFGKGWLNGTQSRLDFIPEQKTDFIFAVCSEEFGLIGVLAMLGLYSFILYRGLHISVQAQDTFNRLLVGSLSVTFFCYALINVGMVSGLLPIVGLPLPLVSYGGTSMVTLLASFGIIMSVKTHPMLIRD